CMQVLEFPPFTF
nr:immunoglobulin light chain junction region [Macaca mulatta]MOX07072.1 immunoglobulin light chain junction region [Macaca mulatta]MOX07078.1 immunoglobulin light chain junction region [Macaca mulatta]MOX07218.1 immunoglobulin light chain junction region [Macaca mulatta]MOX07220.1 immunoglobulin light chain junction region [Macaca mulatta]